MYVESTSKETPLLIPCLAFPQNLGAHAWLIAFYGFCFVVRLLTGFSKQQVGISVSFPPIDDEGLKRHGGSSSKSYQPGHAAAEQWAPEIRAHLLAARLESRTGPAAGGAVEGNSSSSSDNTYTQHDRSSSSSNRNVLKTGSSSDNNTQHAGRSSSSSSNEGRGSSSSEEDESVSSANLTLSEASKWAAGADDHMSRALIQLEAGGVGEKEACTIGFRPQKASLVVTACPEVRQYQRLGGWVKGGGGKGTGAET